MPWRHCCQAVCEERGRRRRGSGTVSICAGWGAHCPRQACGTKRTRTRAPVLMLGELASILFKSTRLVRAHEPERERTRPQPRAPRAPHTPHLPTSTRNTFFIMLAPLACFAQSRRVSALCRCDKIPGHGIQGGGFPRALTNAVQAVHLNTKITLCRKSGNTYSMFQFYGTKITCNSVRFWCQF